MAVLLLKIHIFKNRIIKLFQWACAGVVVGEGGSKLCQTSNDQIIFFSGYFNNEDLRNGHSPSCEN